MGNWYEYDRKLLSYGIRIRDVLQTLESVLLELGCKEFVAPTKRGVFSWRAKAKAGRDSGDPASP
jgi:hypothetical protein